MNLIYVYLIWATLSQLITCCYKYSFSSTVVTSLAFTGNLSNRISVMQHECVPEALISANTFYYFKLQFPLFSNSQLIFGGHTIAADIFNRVTLSQEECTYVIAEYIQYFKINNWIDIFHMSLIMHNQGYRLEYHFLTLLSRRVYIHASGSVRLQCRHSSALS